MDLTELARQAAQELAEGAAVIFLGAGASVGTAAERAEGKGIVGSSDLTRAVAERFGVDLKYEAGGGLRSNLRGVASRTANDRDPSTVKRFVAEKISPQCGTPLRAHRALARVGPTVVMTTNYDDLYESAMREAGKQCEQIVRSEQLAGLPQDRLRILKLHGDFEQPNEIILTGQDYLEWRGRARGLQAEVVGALQKNVCFFVGYSVRDENLREILGMIRENLGTNALKHFALVHDVDEELAAEWRGTVEFVRGDATEFFECLAQEYEALAPRPVDPRRERANFDSRLQSGDLEGAGEACQRLTAHLTARGERAGAASLWRTFGEAARDAGEAGAAVAAFKEAGELLLESGYSLDAEPVLSAALDAARTSGEPSIAREIQPLLQKARLATGHYHEVLRDTEEALSSYGADAPPGLLYGLYVVRAEAREMLEGTDEALTELKTVLDILPRDFLYLLTKTWANAARLLADKYEWEQSHDALDRAGAEVLENTGNTDEMERRRCEAILKLVRGNVHQDLGEDDLAVQLYLDCAPILEEAGETGLAASALQGFVDSAVLIGYAPPDETVARLNDLARGSAEQRRVNDLELQGIAQLAEGSLAAARQTLAQAAAAANAVHDKRRLRNVRRWHADVLLKAGFPHEALVAFAVVGDRENTAKVAESVREELPAEDDGSGQMFDDLIEVAFKGPLSSRGTALTALKQLWDTVPQGKLSELADYLSSLNDLPGSAWADRNMLSDAADVVDALAPRLDDEQARRIGKAVVAALSRGNVFWTSYRSACLALARLANTHPSIVSELDIPVDRLAEMARGDVLNDLHKAMTALVNLAVAADHEGARRAAQELLEDADTLTRVSWRHVLEVSEEELTSSIRELLPRTIHRVQTVEGGTIFSLGGISPLFLKGWTLPEAVKAEVAQMLTEAVADPTVVLPDRQAAALVLGFESVQFSESDRFRAVDALLTVLTQPLESHPTVRSIDNPLSMLRTNIGKDEDVVAAAAESLLALADLVDDERREQLMKEVGKLRAGWAETLGRGVANGLRGFTPRNAEEERWLQTRLLLLLDSHRPLVRQSAARSFAVLVGREILSFDAELLAAIVHLAAAPHIEDRSAAAQALTRMAESSEWSSSEVRDALRGLCDDPSYLVRNRVANPQCAAARRLS